MMDRRNILAALLCAPAGIARAGSSGSGSLDLTWEFVADTVMGGVSQGSVTSFSDQSRLASRLQGTVSLDNNGGFIQMAADILPGGQAFDASGFSGISFETRGNREIYEVRLRTTDLTRPWQSYKAEFSATTDWTPVTLPFASFVKSRTDAPFDPARLRRIGVLAIGREFEANVSIANVRLVR